MILYLDSSALVKLYIAEAEADQVRQWSESAQILACSRVALVEVMSGLARRQRDGTLDTEAADQVRAAFRADWDDYLVLDTHEAAAADLVARHPLPALDAIHLAAALDMAAAPELTGATTDVPVRFASFDQRQRTAAAAEGLAVLPPEPLIDETSKMRNVR